MNDLKDKVAIVTGASKGIGAEIAKKMASAGVSVVINYANSKKEADDVVTSITSTGGKAIAVQADVSKTEAVKTLFTTTKEHFGKIDILVNNAGIMITKPLAQTTDDDFERQFNINVKGVFNTMREAAEHLTDNGRIINLSSTVTKLMLPTYSTYCATKAGVEQLTRIFAKEIGNRGITVNAVAPGPTNTELFVKGKPQAVIEKLASLNPFNRLGEPDDTASVIVFLASDAAAWINAQIIPVNGGMA